MIKKVSAVFVIAVFLSAIPAHSILATQSGGKNTPKEMLNMPFFAREGPINAVAEQDGMWNEMSSFALARGYGSLEDYRRAEEEKRRSYWMKWSTEQQTLKPPIRKKNITIEKEEKRIYYENLMKQQQMFMITEKKMSSINGSIQNMGKYKPPKDVIEKKERLMKYHKLGTPLAELAWRAENETELRDLWVNAEVEIGVRDASKDLSIYGVNITRVFRAPDERNVDKVYGYVKVGALIKLQNDPDVLFVQIPVPPEPVVTSQGVAVIEADELHNLGFMGTSVRVAVIDFGFDINNPEISSNIAGYYSFTGDITNGGDNAHGTAVAEIVVDVAPQVNLYLLNFNTRSQFINAINYAVNVFNVDIIVSSISLFGRFDGQDEVDLTVNNATSNGVVFVTSAGNYAQRHWEGAFVDTNGNLWHEYYSGDETINFYAPAGTEIRIYLSWDDWPASDQDYDLYLYYDDNGVLREVANSIYAQTGTEEPWEYISYNVGDNEGTYHIAIIMVMENFYLPFHFF